MNNEFVLPTGGNFEIIQEGVYDVVLVGVINIGTVKEFFNGKEKFLNKIALLFEFLDLEDEKGRRTMCQDYTASFAPQSTLRKLLEKWREKPYTDEELKTFDISKLVGQRASLYIENSLKKDGSGKYAIIDKIKKKRDSNVQEPNIEPFILGYNNFDFSKLDLLPTYMKTKIEASPEYAEMLSKRNARPDVTTKAPTVPQNDDIPF